MSWFFFVKKKTAYEMRISDWSSDVCSSDLLTIGHWLPACSTSPVWVWPECWMTDATGSMRRWRPPCAVWASVAKSCARCIGRCKARLEHPDRTSVVSGKSVSVRMAHGSRRIIKIKKTDRLHHEHIPH